MPERDSSFTSVKKGFVEVSRDLIFFNISADIDRGCSGSGTGDLVKVFRQEAGKGHG